MKITDINNLSIGQLYRLPLTEDNKENASAGSFVCKNDNSDIVCGFVSEIDLDSNELEICLFESQELPFKARVLREQMHWDDIVELLNKITDTNPMIKSEWTKLVNAGII